MQVVPVGDGFFVVASDNVSGTFFPNGSFAEAIHVITTLHEDPDPPLPDGLAPHSKMMSIRISPMLPSRTPIVFTLASLVNGRRKLLSATGNRPSVYWWKNGSLEWERSMGSSYDPVLDHVSAVLDERILNGGLFGWRLISIVPASYANSTTRTALLPGVESFVAAADGVSGIFFPYGSLPKGVVVTTTLHSTMDPPIPDNLIQHSKMMSIEIAPQGWTLLSPLVFTLAGIKDGRRILLRPQEQRRRPSIYYWNNGSADWVQSAGTSYEPLQDIAVVTLDTDVLNRASFGWRLVSMWDTQASSCAGTDRGGLHWVLMAIVLCVSLLK